jgi:hypothetical protein
VVALATVTQLRAHLQDPDLDADAATQAIANASALVRAASRQVFDFVTQETIVLAGGQRRLVLPQRPVYVGAGHPLTVVELPDLGEEGVAVTDGTHFRRVGNVLHKSWRSRSRPGVVTRGHIEYSPVPPGIWAPWVRVTYSHGYQNDADVPGELTAVVLDAAATYASNPSGLRSIALDGEVTLTYGTETLSAPRSLVSDIRSRLRDLGVRRGGAFSIPAG